MPSSLDENQQDLPVLALGISTHAQGLRLRRARRCLALDGSFGMAFSMPEQDRHAVVLISELDGWPTSPLPDLSLRSLGEGGMLHPRRHRHRRPVRGQSYWLGLLCRTLSFLIPSRFIPALSQAKFSIFSGSSGGRPEAEGRGFGVKNGTQLRSAIARARMNAFRESSADIGAHGSCEALAKRDLR